MAHHVCHATRCTVEVPPRLFMCRRHWYTLPKRLRDLIWQYYEPGQEITKTPTTAYLKAAAECIRFVDEHERAG